MQRQCRRAHWKISLPVAALTALVLMGGCRAPKPGPPPKPAARWPGTTLTVVCPPGPARRLFESHGRTWAHDNGAKLQLTDRSADSPPSILVVAPAELTRQIVGNGVPPLADATETASFLPLYRVRLLNWDAQSFALPLLGDGVLCVFRQDWYADAETKAAYKSKHGAELAAPETWDDFATQAAFFAERRGKPSLPPLPADDAGVDRAYFSIAAPMAVRASTGSLRNRTSVDPNRASVFSFQYDALTGEPLIAAEGFVEALKLLQKLQPLRSPKPDAVTALRDGDAALGLVTLVELAALKGSQAHWGVTRVPGSRRVFAPGSSPDDLVNVVPYVGSTGMLGVIPRGAPAADAAFDLLMYLCSDAISREIVHDPAFGCGPYRDSHLSKQASGWFSYGLDEANTAKLRDILRDIADPRLDNPALVLRTPDQESHRKVVLAAIRKALTGNVDPAAALAEVDREWRKLDGDPAKARTLYRKSLGL